MKVAVVLLVCLYAVGHVAAEVDDPANSGSQARRPLSTVDSTKALMNYLKKTPGWKFIEKIQETCGASADGDSARTKRSEQRAFGFNGTNRIFGGVATKPGQFPWMVRVVYRAGPVFNVGCGGALITMSHVITAAHCVADLPRGITVSSIRAGTRGFIQHLPTIETTIHSGYSEGNHINDIALIKVAKQAVFNEYVNALCLPVGSLAEKSFSGKSGIVAGWGKTETDETSSKLLMVTVPIRDNPTCRKMIPDTPVPITASQLCAGGDKGKDSCSGDSGGPLFLMDRREDINETKLRYYAVGVVSYGAVQCGQQNVPAVYSRVTYFLPWILNNLR